MPAKSGCFGDTGGCSHLCFPKPHGHLTCGCPDNMYLGADDKTCKGKRDQKLAYVPYLFGQTDKSV